MTEGDRVRIILHNELPEPTPLHLHGLELSIAMDGVSFLAQDPIKPGGMAVYELPLHQNGTFFYGMIYLTDPSLPCKIVAEMEACDAAKKPADWNRR